MAALAAGPSCFDPGRDGGSGADSGSGGGAGEGEGEGEGQVDPGGGEGEGEQPARSEGEGEGGGDVRQSDTLELLDGTSLRESFIEALDAEIVDHVLYVCTNVQGMLVFDLSEPERPDWLARLDTPASASPFPHCQHLALDTDTGILYVTNRGDQLAPDPYIVAFDVAVPWLDAGALGLEYYPGMAFEGIRIRDGHIYAAIHQGGLAVLQLIDGTPPIEVGREDALVNAWQLELDDDLAYVADGQGGLKVVDIANPRQPTLLSEVALEGQAKDLQLYDGYVYVALGAAGMAVVDVGDASNPVVVSTVDTPGSAVGVTISVEHAVVSDWNDLRVFDVRDPMRPIAVASERLPVFSEESGGRVTESDFSRTLGIASDGDIVAALEWNGPVIYRLHPDQEQVDLQVTTAELRFFAAEPGDSVTRVVVFSNRGQATMQVLDAWVDPRTGFSIGDLPEELLPGETAFFEVTYTAPEGARPPRGVVEWLTLFTNDPDEREHGIPLFLNMQGLGVGDRIPDGTFPTFGGGEITLEDIDGPVLLAYFATF